MSQEEYEEEGISEARVKEEEPAENRQEADRMRISEQEIEGLKRDAGDYKKKYLEMLADQQNSRRRLEKDREEIVRYAKRTILLDFLHPIDHLENALKYAEASSEEVKRWAVGFEMILAQFKDVLAASGVRVIEAIGKPFDPHLHDAVEMVETIDAPPGTVVEESSRGYTIGDTVLRPSRVKVSKEPSNRSSGEQVQEDEKEAKES